jgi:mono/diheme cytochrome c family protein
MPRLAEKSGSVAAGLIALAYGLLVGGCVGPTVAPSQGASSDPGAAGRGEYLADAGNCAGCHTDSEHGGATLAGGKAIATPFGTYYSRNITPDRAHGIGAWSDVEFLRAVRQGVMPDGAYYFPAFPFPSFTLMTDRDILDIKAYLSTRPPAARENRVPDAPFPFDVRAVMAPWRLLYFRPGPYVPDPRQGLEWNRGAYLANAVSHCGECHTPRGALGALDNGRRFAGTESARSGIRAPDITSDRAEGIGRWSADDIATLLESGMTPQGDFVGGAMAEVVRGTARLTAADRHAIALYVKSIPPLRANGAPGL